MAGTIGARLHQDDIQAIINELAGYKTISATNIGESSRGKEPPDQCRDAFISVLKPKRMIFDLQAAGVSP